MPMPMQPALDVRPIRKARLEKLWDILGNDNERLDPGNEGQHAFARLAGGAFCLFAHIAM